jgi:hypothetical protein
MLELEGAGLSEDGLRTHGFLAHNRTVRIR